MNHHAGEPEQRNGVHKRELLVLRAGEHRVIVGQLDDFRRRLDPGHLALLVHNDDDAVGDAVLDEQRERIDLALGNLPVLAERFYRVTSEGSWVNVYIVGIVGTPFLSNPIDLGSSATLQPGQTGGAPRLHVDPDRTPLVLLPDETVIPGVGTVRTGDDRSIPPPEGFGR